MYALDLAFCRLCFVFLRAKDLSVESSRDQHLHFTPV